jgi:ribosomal protein S18 acetylase RimI-like enzyme
LENEREIIGFINSGATDNVVLSDEAFKELVGHDPAGHCIVIMSVAVHPDYQGQGMASILMNAFIAAMKALNKTEIYLICQESLVAMYERFGFRLDGPSASDHGGMQWQEMSLRL